MKYLDIKDVAIMGADMIRRGLGQGDTRYQVFNYLMQRVLNAGHWNEAGLNGFLMT